MEFDYESYYAALQSRQREPRTYEGRTYQKAELRRWEWKAMKSYNGYSSDERIRGWQMGFWTRAMGLQSWPTTCDVCGSTHNVKYHSECYFNTFATIPLCGVCHKAVHQRFRNPMAWAGFKERYGSGLDGRAPWLPLLPAHEIDLAGWVRETFGDQVRDLMDSPLYHIPDVIPVPLGDWHVTQPFIRKGPIQPTLMNL